MNVRFAIAMLLRSALFDPQSMLTFRRYKSWLSMILYKGVRHALQLKLPAM